VGRRALVLLALSVTAGCAPAPAPPPPDPVAEVRHLLGLQSAAWNRGDLDGFLGSFWHSDSLTFYSGGEMTRGFDAARARYHRRYRTEGRAMGKLDFELHEVRALDGHNAMARGAWTLTRRRVKQSGLFTLVLRRTPDGWRIVHDHSSGGP
jgi:beta-aspartyl-peptidase (threonine type)